MTWADEEEGMTWFGDLSAVMNEDEASDEECPLGLIDSSEDEQQDEEWIESNGEEEEDYSSNVR